MNKELITKLIEKAKTSAENAFCPYTNRPMGCALLVEGNIIFGGCNVEADTICFDAGEVAISKAISEGYTKFIAIAFYAENFMPFPVGKTLQFLASFNDVIQIIIATDNDYELRPLYELLPIRPTPPEVE